MSGSLWGRVRTGLLVSTVTVLVWLVAESQTLRAEQVTLRLRLEGSPTGQVLRAVGGLGASGRGGSGGEAFASREPGRVDLQVQVQLRGGQAALNELRRRLEAGPVVLQTGAELPSELGRVPVDLRGALRSSPVLAGSAVTVSQVQPASVVLEVAEPVTRRVPVRVELPPGVQAGALSSQPSEVELTLPETVWTDLAGEVSAVVNLSRAQLSRLAPGRAETLVGVGFELPVGASEAWYSRVSPERVSVTLTVQQEAESLVVNNIPVQVRLAPTELDQWSISIPVEEQFVAEARLTGPAEEISRFRERGAQVFAVLALSFEELERGLSSKQVEFVGLPPGVTAEAADRTVRFTVSRREGAGG